MATHIHEGDSIECSQSMIAVRKVSKTPTLVNIECKEEGRKMRLFKYKSSIRSIVQITEELNPLDSVVCENSHLVLHDTLEAAVLSIYTAKKVTLETVSNFSHVHGIQGANVNAFTYAKIDIPWPFVLNQKLLKAV